MMTKHANYVETVGLILVGFAIQQMIFGKAPFGDLGTDWGLTNEFNRARFQCLVIECVLIVASFVCLQKRVPEVKKMPVEDGSLEVAKWAFRSWTTPQGKLSLVALIMQTVAGVSTWQLFGNDSAACLAIGFAFIDFSLTRTLEKAENEL
jgi:hypothetical protein